MASSLLSGSLPEFLSIACIAVVIGNGRVRGRYDVQEMVSAEKKRGFELVHMA